MLALVFDVSGAYLLTRYVRFVWLRWILGVVVGILSPIIANLLMYFFAKDLFSSGEILIRTIGSIFWHIIITLVCLWFYRKKKF